MNNMLALSRKVNESIVINNNVEVVVLEVKGDQVKIGIKAPKSVPVYRKEIYDQIEQSNKEATNTNISAQSLKDLFNDINISD